MIPRRTPVSPYIEVLKWLIYHTDRHNFLINDENGGCVRVFLPKKVHKYNNIRDLEEWLNTDFMVNFYEFHNTNSLMALWWKE